jgi:hypothetical protein
MDLKIHKNKRSGQAMLIAVLSLGGAVLGATAIAGFLTLYQIRTTADTENSAKAIFAADTGTEWAQFEYYDNSNIPSSTFSNGASVTVNCYEGSSGLTTSTSCSDPATESAISTGISMSSERAFFLGLSTSTPEYP